jgi:hypothetical protein
LVLLGTPSGLLDYANEKLHVYSAAVCMATVCIVTPTSLLRDLALSGLETAIQLFSGAMDALPRSMATTNLEFLKYLRSQAMNKIAATTSVNTAEHSLNMQSSPESTNAHLEVVGWRTRLIRLASEKRRAGLEDPPVAQTVGSQTNASWPQNGVLALPMNEGDVADGAEVVERQWEFAFPQDLSLPSENLLFPGSSSPDLVGTACSQQHC